MIDLSSGCLFSKGSKAEGANFKGDVWQERLIPIQSEWNCPIGNVTFAPSARNNCSSGRTNSSGNWRTRLVSGRRQTSAGNLCR